MTGVSLTRISRNLVIPLNGAKTNSPDVTETGIAHLVGSGLASKRLPSSHLKL